MDKATRYSICLYICTIPLQTSDKLIRLCYKGCGYTGTEVNAAQFVQRGERRGSASLLSAHLVCFVIGVWHERVVLVKINLTTAGRGK